MSNGTGSLSGIIKNNNTNPVENAVVKLLSTSYDPLMHVSSDVNGNYLIEDIPPGNYNTLCIAQGTTIESRNNITISSGLTTTLNFILTLDPAITLSLLMGNVFDSSTNNPISGACVSLYRLDSNNNQTLIGNMFTNSLGSFVFPKLIQGNYTVYVSSLAYDDFSKDISITQNMDMISVDIPLRLNPISANGTISGIIKNDSSDAINKGDVILYRVNADASLTPVAFTRTNSNGVYLFTNVPKGTYKIKASEIKIS